MAKAEYNPNPSAEWVKETIAAPIAKNMREAGRLPHGEAIDAEVQRMLRRHDAEERENGGPRPTVPVERGKDVAAELAKEKGLAFKRGTRLDKPRQVEVLSPWQTALRNRIRTLCRIVPGTPWRKKHFLYPRFAEEYLREFMAYSTRSGRYQYASDRDAQRMLSRFSEDIADRSTGILGPWRRGSV